MQTGKQYHFKPNEQKPVYCKLNCNKVEYPLTFKILECSAQVDFYFSWKHAAPCRVDNRYDVYMIVEPRSRHFEISPQIISQVRSNEFIYFSLWSENVSKIAFECSYKARLEEVVKMSEDANFISVNLKNLPNLDLIHASGKMYFNMGIDKEEDAKCIKFMKQQRRQLIKQSRRGNVQKLNKVLAKHFGDYKLMYKTNKVPTTDLTPETDQRAALAGQQREARQRESLREKAQTAAVETEATLDPGSTGQDRVQAEEDSEPQADQGKDVSHRPLDGALRLGHVLGVHRSTSPSKPHPSYRRK